MGSAFTNQLRIAMILLAALTVQLATNEGVGPLWEWAEMAALGLIAWASRRYRPKVAWADQYVNAMIAGALLFHFGLEQCVYAISPRLANLMDNQISLAVRSAMLAAVPFCYDRRIATFATLLSLALVSLSVFLTFWWLVSVLAVVYATLAVGLLIGNYWERIRGHFPEGTQTEIPRGASIGAIGIVAVVTLAILFWVGTNQATANLAGFFSSSGGSGASDVRARNGVGDGEEVVGGTKDAMSFGPTDSEIFLESKMPSMFDVYNDTYNPPGKKRKRARKAVALPPSRLSHQHKRIAISQSKGEEFSLRRSSQARKRTPKDVKSPALFFVKGRVPLHLRTHIFDGYDGETLIPATSHALQPMNLEGNGDLPWFRSRCPVPGAMRAKTEHHLLKIINLKTDRVPTPARMSRIAIKDMNRVDMFDYAKDGQTRVALEFIPQMTVFHVESLLIKTDSLLSDSASLRFQSSIVRPAPSESFPQIRELAEAWTSGVPVGYAQIQTIEQKLRTEYRVGPEESDDTEQSPVDQFLLRHKQGSDYMFATAASLLLRELGYTTRVVSGFYAHPNRYEASSHQTPVLSTDVHFWVEVSWDGMVWHTVEPTPGYDILKPAPTLVERIAGLLLACLKYGRIHAIEIAALAFVFAIVWISRKAILRQLIILASKVIWTSDERSRVLWTLRMLELQGRVTGSPRPTGQTLSDYLVQIQSATNGRDWFIIATHWALYSPSRPCPLSTQQLQEACREILRPTTNDRQAAGPTPVAA